MVSKGFVFRVLALNLSHTFIGCLPRPTSAFRSRAAIVSKISIVFIFPRVKAYVSKTDLAVKLVKVILGPSLEQTSKILHTKFCENRPTISGKKLEHL